MTASQDTLIMSWLVAIAMTFMGMPGIISTSPKCTVKVSSTTSLTITRMVAESPCDASTGAEW